MVDGIAAVELAALLLDPQAGEGGWDPARNQTCSAVSPAASWTRCEADLGLLRLPARALRSPAYAMHLAGSGARAACGIGMLRPRARSSGQRAAVAVPAPRRHPRPLADLQRIKTAFDTTVNDVMLAVAAA